MLFSPHVPRPALVVIRFTNCIRFNITIDFYTKFLGEKPTRATVPNRQHPYDPLEYAVFQVGSACIPSMRDIEFRLELCPGDTSDIKGHTLLYWAIDPAKEAETKELAAEYTYRIEVSGGNGATAVLGENKAVLRKYDALVANQFLVTDGFDNFFGGHPNPHFPPSFPMVGGSLLGKLLTALAAGLLLFGGVRLFRGQRR